MKKMMLALLCVLLLPMGAFAITLHSVSMGNEYEVDVVDKIGQNFVLEGVVIHDGIADQDCVIFANLVWGEVLVNHLANDLYYGHTLIGMIGGEFFLTITTGTFEGGHDFDTGPLPPAAAQTRDLILR